MCSFETGFSFPFFEHYLKDAPVPDLPGAFAFETGSNQWRRYASWPPPGTYPRNLYLHANGKLSFNPPSEHENSYDEFVSDPAKPVPYVEHPPTELAPEYMYADQRFATGRADVLTYRTDPVDENVTVAGSITVRLHVSSSASDSDFDVKLIDEYPDSGPSPGYQLLLRGEPMRARFRKSFSNPEALQPDKVTQITFTMPDVNHTFLRGHQIIIQIQSSWFPLVDMNPQIFEGIPNVKATDFIKARQRIFHTAQADSAVVMPLLKTDHKERQ